MFSFFLLCRLLNSICDILYVCCGDLGRTLIYYANGILLVVFRSIIFILEKSGFSLGLKG